MESPHEISQTIDILTDKSLDMIEKALIRLKQNDEIQRVTHDHILNNISMLKDALGKVSHEIAKHEIDYYPSTSNISTESRI